MTWDERRISNEEHQRLESRAASDAASMAQRLWREGIPGGDLVPVAIEATHAFVAQMRQESTGLPRWALRNGLEAMRDYLQEVGDRYYHTFLRTLGEIIGRDVPRYHAVPRATPLLQRASTRTRQQQEQQQQHEQRLREQQQGDAS